MNLDGKEITARPEPSVKDLTIAVVIHLPCRIKRDEGDWWIEEMSRLIWAASKVELPDSYNKLRIVQESWSNSAYQAQCGGLSAVTDSCLDG